MPHPRWIERPPKKLTAAARVLATLLMTAVVATPSMQAQTFRALYSFNSTDGGYPLASMIRDSSGNLYGTADFGGNTSCPSGCGVVFKLDKSHKLTVLHKFAGPPNDGAYPQSALLRDAAGNLYGVTVDDGTAGFGTVYKVDTSGTETVLYSFTGGSDGEYPLGNLVRDENGNFYSTTSGLGTSSGGTIFKLDAAGKLTTLYTFTFGTSGYQPMGNLVRDAAGNLYGTCYYGGTLYGTVYKLDTSGTLTVLHTFDGADGQNPVGGLIADAAGNLYGTTDQGGQPPYGTVFQIVETTGAFQILHTFDGGLLEGGRPDAQLARDVAGNLYGANTAGGGGCHRSGCGTIWKLDTSDHLTVLTNFGKGNQGKIPRGGVVLDKAGNLYGTTSLNGGHCLYCGTVFKITP
jgi:uncharacterized repeat protein (TIGR03803 family)